MVGLFILSTPTVYGLGVSKHPVWIGALQGRHVGVHTPEQECGEEEGLGVHQRGCPR